MIIDVIFNGNTSNISQEKQLGICKKSILKIIYEMENLSLIRIISKQKSSHPGRTSKRIYRSE